MDYIIGWQEYKTEFNGEQVKLQIRPLKTEAMLLLAPYISENPGESTVKLMVNSLELQRLGKKILPDHAKDLQGITVNGQVPDWDLLCDEVMFVNLVVEIIGKLSLISILSKEEKKNSGEPSDMLTSGGEMTAP